LTQSRHAGPIDNSDFCSKRCHPGVDHGDAGYDNCDHLAQEPAGGGLLIARYTFCAWRRLWYRLSGATADPLSELIQVRFFEAVPSTRPAIRHKVATAIRIDAR